MGWATSLAASWLHGSTVCDSYPELKSDFADMSLCPVYLVAGGITVLWSAIIFFFLPPDPIRVKGFDKRQRYIAVARLRVNNAGVRSSLRCSRLMHLLTELFAAFRSETLTSS